MSQLSLRRPHLGFRKSSKLRRHSELKREVLNLATVDARFNEINEEDERLTIVLAVRNELIERVLDECYEKYSDWQAVNYVVHCMIQGLRRMINFQFLYHDAIDSMMEDQDLLVEIPDPSPPDTLASDAVPLVEELHPTEEDSSMMTIQGYEYDLESEEVKSLGDENSNIGSIDSKLSKRTRKKSIVIKDNQPDTKSTKFVKSKRYQKDTLPGHVGDDFAKINTNRLSSSAKMKSTTHGLVLPDQSAQGTLTDFNEETKNTELEKVTSSKNSSKDLLLTNIGPSSHSFNVQFQQYSNKTDNRILPPISDSEVPKSNNKLGGVAPESTNSVELPSIYSLKGLEASDTDNNVAVKFSTFVNTVSNSNESTVSPFVPENEFHDVFTDLARAPCDSDIKHLRLSSVEYSAVSAMLASRQMSQVLKGSMPKLIDNSSTNFRRMTLPVINLSSLAPKTNQSDFTYLEHSGGSHKYDTDYSSSWLKTKVSLAENETGKQRTFDLKPIKIEESGSLSTKTDLSMHSTKFETSYTSTHQK